MFVSIDHSLLSTAMVIEKNNELFFYLYPRKTYVKSGGLNNTKWENLITKVVDVKIFEKDPKIDNTLLSNIDLYNRITEAIMNDIKFHLDDEACYGIIEGYSYNSKSSSRIDLIEFGAHIRKGLFNLLFTNLYIIPPIKAKQLFCKMIYDNKTGVVYRDLNGKSGATFNKTDIMNGLLFTEYNDKWIDHIKKYKEIILKNKYIPKPYDDINDAYMMMLLLKNKEYK
jgi:hypothetical protein